MPDGRYRLGAERRCPQGTAAGPLVFGPADADGDRATDVFRLDAGHCKATLYGKADLADVKAKSKVSRSRAPIAVAVTAAATPRLCPTPHPMRPSAIRRASSCQAVTASPVRATRSMRSAARTVPEPALIRVDIAARRAASARSSSSSSMASVSSSSRKP